MRNLSLILTLLVFGFIGLNAQDNPVEIATITVDEFQEKASEYVGQEIYITGICDHVCKHAGKQLQLVGSTPDVSMKIKAGEKIGKFKKDIEGDNLKILGLVKESRIDEEYCIEWEGEVKEHHKPEEEEYKADMEKIANLKKRVKATEKGYLSFYSMEGIEFEVVK